MEQNNSETPQAVSDSTVPVTGQLSIENQFKALVECPILAVDDAKATKELLEDCAASHNERPLAIQEYDYDKLIEPFDRTNHSLGSLEASLLKSDLDNRTTKLLALDQEILQHQLTIDDSLKRLRALNQTRLENQKEFNLRRYWLSSIRLLPIDVLMTIFLYATSEHLYLPSSPLELSQVCSSWRLAAQACCSLWRSLTVHLYASETHTSGTKLDLTGFLAFWFGRSGLSPNLSLSVIIHTLNPELVNVLTTALRRWGSHIGSLTLHLAIYHRNNYDHRHPLKDFFEVSGLSFPNLQHLCLIDYKRYNVEPQDLPTTLTIFDQSPLLREVTLDLRWTYYHTTIHLATSLPIPWSHLRILKIEEPIHFDEWINVFFQCPNLVTAVFKEVSSFRGEEVFLNFDGPVKFPDLEVLYVYFKHNFSDTHFPNHFLSKICLPALKHLRLMGGLSHFELELQISFTSFSTFSSGPYPSLKELSLGRIIIELGDLLAILNACPLLEILGLYLDLPPKSLLESLTLQDAQIRPPLWVKHLKLFMFGVNTPDVEHNPVVDVIASAFGDLIVSWITSPEPPDQTLEFSIDMYDDSIPMSGKSFPATEDKVRDIINNVIKREVPSKDLDLKLRIGITTSFIWMYSIFSDGDGILDNP